MKLYVVNDTDYVIAGDAEDAIELMVEITGDYTYDLDDDNFDLLNDDKKITIWCDPDGEPTEPDDTATRVTKSAREWCQRGRGFLCTTEF